MRAGYQQWHSSPWFDTWLRLAYHLALLCACVWSMQGASYYVSPTGSATNSGAIGSPWSLAYAIQASTTSPGDTVWLRAGTYSGGFSSFAHGTVANPVTFRNYGTERAIIDSPATNITCLQINGTNTTWRGLEFTCSVPDRTHRDPGINIQAANTKLINLIVHDVGVGIYNESGTSPVEIYGCVIYNHGDALLPQKHGIYTHSNLPGGTTIKDNVVINGYYLGIHAYGELGATMDGFNIIGNIVSDSGSLFGTSGRQANYLIGGVPATDNSTMVQNMGYFSGTTTMNNAVIGYSTYENGTITVSSNYFGHGAMTVNYWTNMTFTANEFADSSFYFQYNQSTGKAAYTWDNNTYGTAFPFVFNSVIKTFPQWKADTGFDAASTVSAVPATGSRVFVRPNTYETGRANVVVYNWDNADNVSVSLASVCTSGTTYTVRNAANYFGPTVKTFTYSGSAVSLPMTNLVAATPVGASAPAATGPTFNAFVIERQAVQPPVTKTRGFFRKR